MNIGERLRRRRIDLDLTPKEAGHLLGITEQYVGQFERGDNKPPAWQRLIDFARVYQCSVDYLLGLTDDPSPRPKAMPIPMLSVHEANTTYTTDRIQEMIWLMRDLPEEKQQAILEIAKVVKNLN